MKLRSLIFTISAVLLLQGCGTEEAGIGPKRETTVYEERTFRQDSTGKLDIVSDYGNIEVFKWDKKEVKLEMTKKLRGMYAKDVLDKKMEDFKVEIGENPGNILIKSNYKGNIRNAADRSLDIKLHLPKKIRSISIQMDTGTIKILDDLRCDLSIETKAVNSEINKFYGKLISISELGNLKIAGGKLKKGSMITAEMGNISVKSDFEQGESYSIETRLGNIDVQLPDKLKATVESIGNVSVNEFEGGDHSTKIKLQSGMGKITVSKYQE